ncbi:MAG: carbohydrate ABC transporter permease [Gemmiger sp.]|nr:carbohydrate ABC transporter permease [Gemmiger sp.]
MHIKESRSRKAFMVFDYVLMVAITLICIYPFLYVVFASFSDPAELMKFNGALLSPRGFTLAGYQEVFKKKDIISGYSNTILITVTGTVINIVMTALGAYFLSRRDVVLKVPVMIFIMITMYISGGMIPSYLNIRSLGLYQSYWALILPGAVSTMNLIIMRTAFQSIPESLEEAAILDGASHMTILFRIILPLSKATVAVLVLYYALGHWNDWFGPMIYLQGTPEKYPLQLILRNMLIDNQNINSASGGTDQFLLFEVIKYVVIVISTVPMLIFYPFVQKYFEKGVMIGGVKG